MLTTAGSSGSLHPTAHLTPSAGCGRPDNGMHLIGPPTSAHSDASAAVPAGSSQRRWLKLTAAAHHVPCWFNNPTLFYLYDSLQHLIQMALHSGSINAAESTIPVSYMMSHSSTSNQTVGQHWYSSGSSDQDRSIWTDLPVRRQPLEGTPLRSRPSQAQAHGLEILELLQPVLGLLTTQPALLHAAKWSHLWGMAGAGGRGGLQARNIKHQEQQPTARDSGSSSSTAGTQLR